MKPIEIYADSRWFGTCRSCGADIEWGVVAGSDKRMPFNRPIVLEPTLLEGSNLARVDMEQTTSHFATCPDAKRWRKNKKA